ncbi:polycomb group protein Psc-like [Haliotis cracherodii]|uniref:polycomb group protein Psc-like n=1 Tax=Haliotis cracherodii TaxID=6455 RepID=UPI0039EBD4FE
MHRTTRARLDDLNHHLVCVLCGGYFIDATSIIECLHSFCRTCIVRYLESSKFCPICDVQVHKTRPLLNIRADKTLQNLVYKLVPGLFEDEMRRRRLFYSTHPEGRRVVCLEARGEAVMEKELCREDENISLCLDMSKNGLPPDESESYHFDNKPADRRFLLCPSALTIAHLKKFIRMKFSLPEHHKLDIFHSDESLTDTFTLLDIAYIYSWRRKGPLRLFYTVDDKPNNKRKPSAAESQIEADNDVKRTKMEEVERAEDDTISCTHIKQERQAGTHAQIEICDAGEMFSDISDYEPSPLPDFSQHIPLTSEGSDSTITYGNTEDNQHEPTNNNNTGTDDAPVQSLCSSRVCDSETSMTESSNSVISTAYTKLPPLSNKDQTVSHFAQGIDHSLDRTSNTKLNDEGYVPQKQLNGVTKDMPKSEARSNGVGYTSVKIWQKPNGITRVKPDNNGIKQQKGIVCTKFQNTEDRANNNTINVETKLQNGHEVSFSVDLKSEPLDLSEPSRKGICGQKPIVIGEIDF